MYENYQILRRRGYADWLVKGLGKPLNCPSIWGYGAMGAQRLCKPKVEGSTPSSSTIEARESGMLVSYATAFWRNRFAIISRKALRTICIAL